MKKILLLIVGIYFCIPLFCQSPTVYDSPYTFKNLIIEKGTEVINNSTLTVNDTLFVYGTLTNNGKILAKTCIVDSAKLYCAKNRNNNLTISENLILKNTTIYSSDTTYFAINTYDCIIDDKTDIQSASLIIAHDIIINDTLIFSNKKLGVKKVFGDFIINAQGCFTNSINDNIQLYGNAINNSAKTCTNANFEVFGTDKHIYGNFSCYRFELHDGQATYTNHNWLEVTDNFVGNGTVTQAPNAYLSIHTETTPSIIADALGNTLEYTRGGTKNQYLNTSHCYNLVLSKDNSSKLALTQNCIIENALTLNKKSFLDCNSHALIFNHANKNSIITANFKEERGIFLNKGTINLTIPKDETIVIPLFTIDTIFAGIALKNLDDNHNKINIDSLWNYVTKTGKSNGETFQTDFINTTWHAKSEIEKATISFYWNFQKEQPQFNEGTSTIFTSDGTFWEPSAEKNIKLDGKILQITTNPNSFFTVGNAPSLLGNNFDYFTLTMQNEIAYLAWETQNKTLDCSIERASSNHNFSTIVTLLNSDGIYYFSDSINFTTEIVYYRIKQTNSQGDEKYTEIRSLILPQQAKIHIDQKSKTILVTSENNYIISLYNINGCKLQESQNSPLNLYSVPHDYYIVSLKTNRGTFQQKFIW